MPRMEFHRQMNRMGFLKTNETGWDLELSFLSLC